MANKVLSVIVVVIVVVAAVAVAFTVLNDDDDEEVYGYVDLSDLKLLIYGNVNNDFTIDEDDMDLLEEIIAGSHGDVDEALATYPFADVNYDGSVDQSDIDLLQRIIDREPCTLYVACMDTNSVNTAMALNYPLNNIMVSGSNAISGAFYAGVKDSIVCYVASPTNYPNMFEGLDAVHAVSEGSMGSMTYYTFDLDIFTQVDLVTPIDAIFAQSSLGDTANEAFATAGIPCMLFGMNSPQDQTSYIATIAFLCGEETEDVGYQYATDTVAVLQEVSDRVAGIADEDKAVFMIFSTRYSMIAQNSHYYQDIGILAGGIPYYQTNPDFAANFEGTSASSSLPDDVLAEYRDADAYVLLTPIDFGQDPDEVIIYYLQNTVDGASQSDVFLYGVTDRWHMMNNMTPGAVKVAYMAEILYPELFAGYGDEVLQYFIDAGYDPLADFPTETLIAYMSYQDYLDALERQGA